MASRLIYKRDEKAEQSSALSKEPISPHPRISFLELSLYCIAFIAFISYGTYNVYEVSAELRNNDLIRDRILEKGRFFFSHRENKDTEWKAFESTRWILLFLAVLNAACSWFLNAIGQLQLRRWTAAFVGILAFAWIVGLENAGVVLFTTLVVYSGMSIIHPLFFGWLSLVLVIVPFNFRSASGSDVLPWIGDYYSKSFAYWYNAWSVMRFISFGHEWYAFKRRKLAENEKEQEKSKEKPDSFDFVDLLAFSFYLPTLFGPLISYPQFYTQVIASHSSKIRGVTSLVPHFFLRVFTTKFFIVGGWLLCISIFSECFYINTLAASTVYARLLNGFGAAALTWLHGQYFQAKYMILYGFPWLSAYIDGGVTLLPLPIFISRVYLYSKMWKYFDTGLYDFMKRYIYVPLGGYSAFLPATLAVFTFIFVWHGLNTGIAIWALVNFFQVVCEYYLRRWSADSSSKLSKVRLFLSPTAWRGLTCAACTLSFQLSVAVISVFLMGQQVGLFITKWTIFNLNVNYFLHFVCMYCWIHLVFSWENWMVGCEL